MLDERAAVFVEISRELEIPADDVLVDHHGIRVVEGIDAGEHFVHENAESPPVDALSVALVQNNLRGDEPAYATHINDIISKHFIP